jgi:hypothetical protein
MIFGLSFSVVGNAIIMEVLWGAGAGAGFDAQAINLGLLY